MTRLNALATRLLLVGALIGRVAAGDDAIEFIPLDDLKLSSTLQVKWCWNATGIDAQDRVYAVYGGPWGDLTDCAVFRYDARTGNKEFLGTAIETLKAAENYHEGERVEKGHTHLPFLDGKIFIGTQGFHFASGANSPGMRDALNSRGAHILGYDTQAERLFDLSRHEPAGVFFDQRGFIALTVMPSQNLLIGLTVPQGDLLLYDVSKDRVLSKVAGVPSALGTTRISREVVAARNSKIYWMYGPLKPSDGPGQMYVYDLNSGQRNSEPIAVDPWCWNGQAIAPSDGSVYLSDQPGHLYRLDTNSDRLETLGRLVPEAELANEGNAMMRFSPPVVQGIYLSTDEKRIYAIASREMTPLPPVIQENGKPKRFREPIALYAFDLGSREVREVHRFPRWNTFCYVTGSNVKDTEGNLYFAVHAGKKGLMKVNVEELRTQQKDID
ncbi:hypothetical protein [Crateriforma conspicua]|uniref:SMP-30/Gluconolaconase/LRE-like region n=1 Tax=Crateriforma conspicua TaxID=2527996 RepID=A0A5C6FTP4_9PLAN|nr:hypothetical protein V7x_01070 [Crateriforma conspicua]